MAITTLEKVKASTGIKNKDEQIEELIPLVENWITGYTNQLIPLVDGSYPPGFEKVAIGMIVYDLNIMAKQGVKSESLSRHSVTFSEGDYPTTLTKGLRRRLRW